MTLRTIFAANLHRVELLVRYYGVGAINTAFGYGLFALLLLAGLNLFVAQIVAHVLGSAFNYFTYSRHVFRKSSDRRPLAFVGAYGLNYLVNLGLLAAAHHFIRSPYLAGFVAVLIGSGFNFFVLKSLVFPPGPDARRAVP